MGGGGGEGGERAFCPQGSSLWSKLQAGAYTEKITECPAQY